MKTSLILLMLVAPMIGIAPGLVNASDDEFSIAKVRSVQEAVKKISASLKQQGFIISLTLDHQANAARVDSELRPTQLIVFRDPDLEKNLLPKSSTIGIDLPLKILVWEDEHGAIRQTFNPPGYLLDRHRVKGGLKGGLASLERSAKAQSKSFGRMDPGLITIDSTQSFENTVDSLVAAIRMASRPDGCPSGFGIPLKLDYRDFVGTIRGRRPPVLIVFGNPCVGTPLMQEQQSIGVDLPQKFLVWEGEQRQVHITYNDPLFLGKRHAIVGQSGRLVAISTALAKFAAAGANR